MAAIAVGQTIVVSSVFGELYSDDGGATWAHSTGGGPSQSVRYFGTTGDGGKKFGVAATYGPPGQWKQGVNVFVVVLWIMLTIGRGKG